MSDSMSLGGLDSRDSAGGPDSILSAIRQAAEGAGLDPTANLYNTARDLAQAGHYGQARAHLQVLLGLAPQDGEARLLLAKVLVAGKQWRQAMAALDEASACGVRVPEELQEAVRQKVEDSSSTTPATPREPSKQAAELSKLKNEVRHLRSENARLTSENVELGSSVQKWAVGAAVTAAAGVVLLLSHFFTSGPTTVEDVVQIEPVAQLAEVPVQGAPATAPAAQPTPAPSAGTAIITAPSNPEEAPLPSVVNDRLASEVSGIIEAQLTAGSMDVRVRNGVAVLKGTAPTWKQLKGIQAAAVQIDGIESVDTEGIVLLARRDGAMHTIGRGESLSAIAEDYYGSHTEFQRIMDANPGLNPTTMQLGQKITIPPIGE